jgi:aspartate aminotransferase
MMKLSLRLDVVPASPIRKLVPLAVKAKREGVRVYHLNIGDPDIKTPEVMIDVLHRWKINPIGYGQSQGEPVFLEALRTYYHRSGFRFIESAHLQATSGGSEAISMAMFAVCDPGDEILTFEPLYTNYNSYAAITGVTLTAIATTIKTGFHLPPQKDIEKRISKKTKAILFCNPNNPTGTVYRKEEVDMLVSLAKKYGLYLLSDEVYREYTYDGKQHVSLLSYMQAIPEHAIVLDSMSKRYSLCGVRLGALVSLNADIMAGVLRIAQGRLSAGLVDQYIAAELTAVPDSYFRDTHREYEKRRDVLYEGLKKIHGVIIPKPEGAFYAIVGLPVADSERFCQWLLTDFRDSSASSGQAETLMLAPASGFYATKGKGKNEVRIAYVLNTKDLKRCIDLLRTALKVYNTT